MINIVHLVSKTEMPNTLAYIAMHQDYYAGVACKDKIPDEARCGESLVSNLLKGNRGHFGCLEHPAISFNLERVPHSVMQQIRTHRVGISFDVQSFRYTSDSILDAVKTRNVENAVYLRPVGHYKDRNGKDYEYSFQRREQDKETVLTLCDIYAAKYDDGMPEEMARGLLPFDYYQNLVVSFNCRSLMHVLDLRWKADAQLEAQILMDNLFKEFKKWRPEVATWYNKNRAHKARLSP